MIICGLKLTHDGAVAVIKDNKLLFSIEIEKIANNPRYSGIEDTSTIEAILLNEGLKISDIDVFAVDGWGGFDENELAVQPRLEIGPEYNKLRVNNKETAYELKIAQYREKLAKDNVLETWKFPGFKVNGSQLEYASHLHVAGHISSAYCTSPFAKYHEDAYVLIWDGGMFPRLYYVSPDLKNVENLGPIFLLIGNIYTIFAQHFGPFKVSGNFAKDDLSIAGKVMAYIALGNVRPELFELFDSIYRNNYEKPMGFANTFAQEFKKQVDTEKFSDEDILATFHAYLENLLVEKLVKKIKRHSNKTPNLCLAGGCALNIKWNSAIRQSNHFKDVYVPPYPNDSGSAIGAACTSMINLTGNYALDWSVYAGPRFILNDPAPGWSKKEFSVQQLAKLLHDSQEPVLFMNGRAELGPRALGNRSIIAGAESLKMKDLLNEIKQRESYRPISPICLENRASEIFDPGIRDPYMLFDHQIRPEWIDKIPAVRHLDNSSRLQTVSKDDNEVLHDLLTEYEKFQGIPILCNTSANFKGTGFFPDVKSATSWGGVNYVWADGLLYFKGETF